MWDSPLSSLLLLSRRDHQNPPPRRRQQQQRCNFSTIAATTTAAVASPNASPEDDDDDDDDNETDSGGDNESSTETGFPATLPFFLTSEKHHHSFTTTTAITTTSSSSSSSNDFTRFTASSTSTPPHPPLRHQQHRPRLQALRDQLRGEHANNNNTKKNEAAAAAVKIRPETPFLVATRNKNKVHHSHRSFLPFQRQQEKEEEETSFPPVEPRTSAATTTTVAAGESILTDRHGRFHNYLRLSVTERCNLRCTYCMPAQGVVLQPPSHLLSTIELLRLATLFRTAGVTKFRLTGGEPTLRHDLLEIVRGLQTLQPHSIGITTNGIALGGGGGAGSTGGDKLRALHEAGLTSINISLDTLKADKFATLTRRPASYLQRVWNCLETAVELAAAVSHNDDTDKKPLTVKLNCVVMRHTNLSEVADFVQLADDYDGLVQVRFIEYMPFSDNGWNWDECVPYRELLQQFQSPPPEAPDGDNTNNNSSGHVLTAASVVDDLHDTTKWYTTTKGNRIGFITSMSQHFCASCNRLRLTADGRIKVCLFDGRSDDNNNVFSLRDALRSGQTAAELQRLVSAAVQTKHATLGGHSDPADIRNDAANNRPMTLIGG